MTTTPLDAPGPLLLAGGTSWTGAGLRAVATASAATQALVIPTGAAFEGAAAAVAHISVIAGGLEVVELPVTRREHTADPALVEAVRAARLIVLPGDSSLHIRSVMKETVLWSAVLEAWTAGAAVVGIGGGAAVLCDPMIDDRGGAFTLGLGLVQQMALLPHADRWGEDRMKRTLRLVSRGVAFVTVDDDAALCWDHLAGWTPLGNITVRRDGVRVECSTLPQPSAGSTNG